MRRLLAELAYLACIEGRTDHARRILAGLDLVRPGSREVRIGQALAALSDGHADEAVAALRPLADAGDAYGAGFLVLTLRLAGRTAEADAVRSRAPAGDDAASALLALTL